MLPMLLLNQRHQEANILMLASHGHIHLPPEFSEWRCDTRAHSLFSPPQKAKAALYYSLKSSWAWPWMGSHGYGYRPYAAYAYMITLAEYYCKICAVGMTMNYEHPHTTPCVFLGVSLWLLALLWGREATMRLETSMLSG